MKFIERLTGIFMKPGETMKDIAREPRIEESVVIVGIYAILFMLYTYVSTTRLNIIYDMPGLDAASGLRTIMTVVSLVFSLVMPFIIWLIIAGVLHLFAMAFGGSGKFYPNIVTGIGYSQIVKIFTILIALILLTQVPVMTMHISSSNPLAAVSAAGELSKNIYYLLSSLVVLIGVIISSYLGMLAIKEGEKLTMTQAAMVVGIPLAIYVIYNIASVLLLR
jgi:hypothetical protein